MKRTLCTLLALCSLTTSWSQQLIKSKKTYHAKNKIYSSTNIDGLILSTSFLNTGNGDGTQMTTPRFTAFFHIGRNFNYDFNRKVGLYSGINIKNIGFIEKFSMNDSTVIRRSYTFGIPLGLKIGDIDFGNYALIGGGVDFPFHYKEKGFIKRSKKTKTTEWFSSRTNYAMPYIFLGAHLRPGVALKLQYYPTNFMNSHFQEKNGLKPYENYNVNLLMLTVGTDINYRPKKRKG